MTILALYLYTRNMNLKQVKRIFTVRISFNSFNTIHVKDNSASYMGMKHAYRST